MNEENKIIEEMYRSKQLVKKANPQKQFISNHIIMVQNSRKVYDEVYQKLEKQKVQIDSINKFAQSLFKTCPNAGTLSVPQF